MLNFDNSITISIVNEDLKKSGLDDEIIERAKVDTFDSDPCRLRDILNIPPERAEKLSQNRIFISFPYFERGEIKPVFNRVKIIPPIKGEDGKPVKYLQPTGIPPIPYILPEVWEIANNPKIPLWITEGEKKTLKLIQHGEKCVGLQGVWNFKPAKENAPNPLEIELCDELLQFDWSKRTVYLAFDSDFTDNAHVRMALYELTIRLMGKEAEVKIVHWSPLDGKGIDDFLVKKTHPAEFIEILKEKARTLSDFIKREHAPKVIRGLATANLSPEKFDHFIKGLAPSLGLTAAKLRKEVEKKRQGIIADKSDPTGSPYEIRDGTIGLIAKNNGYSSIADGIPLIAKVGKKEDGNDTYTIAGKAKTGNDFSFAIDAKEFSDPQKLKSSLDQALGANNAVSAGMREHVGPAIKRLSNPQDIKTYKLYNRTGWFNYENQKRFLIPGLEPDGVEINFPNRKLNAYHVNDKADLGKGLEALDALIESCDPAKTTIALSFLFQAPLADLAGWRNERYALFIKGRTGSLKTSFAQTAMCIYGQDFSKEDTLIKWGEGATRNSVMAFATSVSDLPLLIDNYKPNTGKGSTDFVNLMHNILEGGEKDRCNRDSTLKESKPVFAWPICTGEDVPDNDSASLARIVVVSFDWQNGNENKELSQAQLLSDHLSSVGNLWIKAVEEMAKDKTIPATLSAMFAKKREDWAKYLRQRNPKMVNILRVASNLATNEITWTMISMQPDLREILGQYDDAYHKGLLAVADEMSSCTTESLEANRLIDCIDELVSGGRCSFEQMGKEIKQDSNCVGWVNSDGSVYILMKLAKYRVEQLLGVVITISEKTLNNQLDQVGYLQSKGGDRKAKSINIAGRSIWVIHLKPGVIGSVKIPKPSSPSWTDIEEAAITSESPQITSKSPQITG